MKINALVLINKGMLLETREEKEPFCLQFGKFFGVFEPVNCNDNDEVTFELKTILQENEPLPYKLNQQVFVLYSRQEAILAHQAICAYARDLALSDPTPV